MSRNSNFTYPAGKTQKKFLLCTRERNIHQKMKEKKKKNKKKKKKNKKKRKRKKKNKKCFLGTVLSKLSV